MGDYAAATLTLYGVTGKEAHVLAVLDNGWALEWGGGGPLATTDLAEGVELYDADCNVGWIFDGCGTDLAELGITYEFCQDAKYEYNGTVEICTPEPGVFQSPGSQEGEIHVPAAWIEHAIEEATTLDALCDALWRLTGHSWTAALVALASAHPADT